MEPNLEFFKQQKNSVFDKEYDYLISLGHRCCVGLANGYQRKSSFPLDWQITKIDLLPSLFLTEFEDFYPNSGVIFVHEYHKEDENGKSLGVDPTLTASTFNRRCERLVNLIKSNNRRLLFVRSKYDWYWAKKTHTVQLDQHCVEYDIQQLQQVSEIIKNQYKNDKSDFLYIYNDLTDEDLFDRDPSCKKENLQWKEDGTIDSSDLVLPYMPEQFSLAKRFKYHEMPSSDNIYQMKVCCSGVRVEAMCYNSQIFDRLKISDVKDF
jgi:hypothetical protein